MHTYRYNCVWLRDLVFSQNGLGGLECQQTRLLVFSYLANLSSWFHGHKMATISPGVVFAFKA